MTWIGYWSHNLIKLGIRIPVSNFYIFDLILVLFDSEVYFLSQESLIKFYEIKMWECFGDSRVFWCEFN